jgi:hypothetical protein
MSPDPKTPVVAGDGESLTPTQMRAVVAKSRKYESVAVLTVVAAMLGAVATMASSVVHDYAAVRIAEAQARAKVCP